MTRYIPLLCLTLTHTLVDTCALLIAPLWPRLSAVHAFGVAGLSIAFIAQSLPTSVSQLVFGYLRDRHPAPVWLWLGPVVAALFLTPIGLVDSRWLLFVFLMAGGIGVGAFHPEAAVLAGRMLPGESTRGISVFMFGGSLGLALGPALSGLVVEEYGLSGLALLGPPVLLLILVLSLTAARSAGMSTPGSGQRNVSGGIPASATSGAACEVTGEVGRLDRPRTDIFDGRGRFALLLLLVCSLRLVPNMAMDKVLAFVLERPEWGYSTQQIGLAQSVFLIAASAGMMLMMFRFRAGREKLFLVVCPLAAVPLMAVLSWQACPPWLLFSTLAASGVVLWGTSPAMVSYAQQQFPRGAGVASALTMGMAWGIGGLIQAPVTAWFQHAGMPQRTFLAFIPCLLMAGGGAMLLPDGPAPAAPSDSECPVEELLEPETVPQGVSDEVR